MMWYIVKRAYVDAQKLCNEDETEIIIPMHLITGADPTSGFYGVGKKTVADRVRNSDEAKNLLTSCGASLHLTDEAIADMTKFVIKYVYNYKTSLTPSAARVKKWRSQKRKSLARMIADAPSLLPNFKRVN